MSTTVAFGASTLALLAVFFPRILVWRLGVFLYFFYVDALLNSYGFPGYATRINVFVSFTLLFLPSIGSVKNVSRKNLLACFAVFLVHTVSVASYVRYIWILEDLGIAVWRFFQ